jgi:uroporphyrin-III C-methyltransferase
VTSLRIKREVALPIGADHSASRVAAAATPRADLRSDPPSAARLPAVWLVGAGPGDPDLLTVRALRALGRADVVLADDLVDSRVLALVRDGARVLRVGKRGGRASTDQAFIHRVMIREARRGQHVVRLKGGDPFVFGRGGEEVDALQAAGIAIEVVPGITAGIAAPAAIGIAVTDRRHVPGVAFVTGHGQAGAPGPDWGALARSGLTLVVYMGVARCASIADALIAGGLHRDTPAAAIGAAHTPHQRHSAGKLGDLADRIERDGIVSPAILVIGDVAANAERCTSLVVARVAAAERAAAA